MKGCFEPSVIYYLKGIGPQITRNLHFFESPFTQKETERNWELFLNCVAIWKANTILGLILPQWDQVHFLVYINLCFLTIHHERSCDLSDDIQIHPKDLYLTTVLYKGYIIKGYI